MRQNFLFFLSFLAVGAHGFANAPTSRLTGKNAGLLRSSDAPTTTARSTSTQLQAGPVPLIAAAVAAPAIRRVALAAVAGLAFYKRRKFLYYKDPDVDAPLPEGTFGGCPLLGNNLVAGDPKTGLSGFSSRNSKALGNPRIWKFLGLGKPCVAVSGHKNVRAILGKDFNGVSTPPALGERSSMVVGNNNILVETDKKEHAYLRKLLGQSMTPDAIEEALPSLQATCQETVNDILKTAQENGQVNMERATTDLTLDVAHSQILGLGLTEEEIQEFRKQVQEWTSGSFSPRVAFLPFTKQTKPYKARLYLVDKIENKMRNLRSTGPDGSTLSGMVFAKDDEGQNRLSDAQIIDNALALIFAGSETSASTLTNAMLLLGLHPDVYRQLRQEQEVILKTHNSNSDITRSILEKEMPLLEAVVQETMRMCPISCVVRQVHDTTVLDERQIPAKTLIGVSIQLTHELDPVTYKEDGSHMDIHTGFQPSRWLDEDTRPTTDYIPFNWGPRYCLGANLAMAEMKLFLASFVRSVESYDLVIDKDKIRFKRFTIMPKPADGCAITNVKIKSPVEA